MYRVSFMARDVKQRIGFSWCSIQPDPDHFKNALIGPDPNLNDQIRTSLIYVILRVWDILCPLCCILCRDYERADADWYNLTEEMDSVIHNQLFYSLTLYLL